MLEADGQSQQIRRRRSRRPFDRRTVLDEALDAPERGRGDPHAQPTYDVEGTVGVAADADRQHRAKPACHLPRRDRVLRVARKAGVDRDDTGERGEPRRERQRGRARALDPREQRAHAAEQQGRVERAQDRAFDRARAGDVIPVVVAVPGHERAREEIRVSAEVLRRRVHHEVGAVLERTRVDRGRRRRVDSDACARGVGEVADRGEIRDLPRRVGRRLDPHELGQPRPEDGRERAHVGGVVGVVREAPPRGEIRDPGAKLVVADARNGDVVAGPQGRPDRDGGGGHPRREQERGLAPFEGRDHGLGVTVGRVLVTPVGATAELEVGIAGVRRREVDRWHDGARRVVDRVEGLRGQGLGSHRRLVGRPGCVARDRRYRVIGRSGGCTDNLTRGMLGAMERRVVIIEDERDVARLLEFNLRGAGFDVITADTGAEGLAKVQSTQPDVVVLDLMLPDTSGYDVCKQIRSDPKTAETGVIMLTAKGEAEDRILGLEVGADDYVVKPFVVREVVLRVTALGNRLAERRARSTSSNPNDILNVGPIELDPVTHDVRISGVPTQLRPLEYKLLHLLVSEPGRVFSREELLEQVWEMRGDINTRTVDVHVRRLRVSLGPAADVIETVHGFGYRAKRDPA